MSGCNAGLHVERPVSYDTLYPYSDNDSSYMPPTPSDVKEPGMSGKPPHFHTHPEPSDNDGAYMPPAGKPDPRDKLGKRLPERNRPAYYYYYYYYPHDNEAEVFDEEEENYIQPFFLDNG